MFTSLLQSWENLLQKWPSREYCFNQSFYDCALRWKLLWVKNIQQKNDHEFCQTAFEVLWKYKNGLPGRQKCKHRAFLPFIITAEGEKQESWWWYAAKGLKVRPKQRGLSLCGVCPYCPTRWTTQVPKTRQNCGKGSSSKTQRSLEKVLTQCQTGPTVHLSTWQAHSLDSAGLGTNLWLSLSGPAQAEI